ncbi:MAG TPA: hypothetical protein VL863_14600, partial [bacterium]|nr:hypothetical protein [bacterium]
GNKLMSKTACKVEATIESFERVVLVGFFSSRKLIQTMIHQLEPVSLIGDLHSMLLPKKPMEMAPCW